MSSPVNTTFVKQSSTDTGLISADDYINQPGKYQAELVMREACRLLVESADPVNIIADKLNFDDPLYFSWKFHKSTGQSPTEYRRLNQPFSR